MTAPLWTDERIHTQAITYSGYIGGVIRALTEMRDEYEAALTVANGKLAIQEERNAELERDRLTIARLLSDVGIEHSGHHKQAQRVEMLVDKLRNSQHNVICFAKERNDARKRIAELDAALDGSQSELRNAVQTVIESGERIAELEHIHAGWQAVVDDRDAVIARLMAKSEIPF